MLAKVKHQLSCEYLSRCLIFSFFIAIFSGYYSFDRLLSFQASSFLTEFRFWGLSVCLLLLLIIFSKLRLISHKPSGEYFLLPVIILLFYGVVVSNVIVLGNPSSMSDNLVDAIFVAVLVVLTLFIIKNKRDLVVFAVIAEVIGLALLVLVIAGIDNPEVKNARWSPIGGVITFYKLEFLACCAALYLSSIETNPKLKIIHLTIAVITSFASLMTLSKAPLIGMLAVIGFISTWLVSKNEFPRLLVVWLVFILSLAFFYLFGGENFESRLNALKAKHQDTVNRPSAKHPDTPLTLSELIDIKKFNDTDLKFEDLDQDEKEKIKAIATIIGDGAPDYRNDLQGFIRYNDRLLLLYDRSYRSQLLAYSVHLYSTDVWKGIGAGNYSYLGFTSSGNTAEHKYPHNILVEILVEYGLVGLLVFGLAFLVTSSLLLRVLIRETSSLYLVAYVLFLFVTSMFSGDLYDFRLFWLISAVIVAAYSSPAPGPLKSQVNYPGSPRTPVGDPG